MPPYESKHLKPILVPMSKFLPILLLLLATISLNGQHQTKFKFPSHVTTQDYDQQHLVLKLKDSKHHLTLKQIESLQKLGLRSPKPLLTDTKVPTQSPTAKLQKLNQLGMQSIFKIAVQGDKNLESIINEARQLGWFEYVEPIYNHQLMIDPDTLNEPFTGFHWGHLNANIYDAWDSTFGDPSVVVGIIDAGCKTTHLSLKDRLYYNDAERFGLDNVDDDNNGYVDDSLGYDFADRDGDVNNNFGHGTEVAGIISAKLSDGVGSFGVAPNCRFMPMNIANSSGILVNGYEAIVYAAENGCDIINLSWGRIGNPTQFEQDIINMVVETYDVLIVAAAGNTAAKLNFYPASYDNVVSVAHITFENIGFATYSDFIDVSAPGVSIPSTTLGNGIDGFGHTLVTGSSFASPFVGAIAALIKSKNPDLNAHQITELIRQTANPDIYDVPENSGKAFGTGRVDAHKALTHTDSISAILLVSHLVQNEGDTGVITAGNTAKLLCEFTNIFNPTTQDFTVSISTESSGITLIDSVFEAGIIAFQDTISNASSPFRFKISSSIAPPKTITFNLDFNYGNFVDRQQLTFDIVNPSVNATFNRISTTIDANGRIGFTGNSFGKSGIGFLGDFNQTLDTDSTGTIGLIVAAGPNKLVDCVFNEVKETNEDFSPMSIATIQEANDSVVVVSSNFTDGKSSTPIGLHFRQQATGWKSIGRQNYILISYEIENQSGQPLDSLQVGLFADWKIADGLNHGQWDDIGQFGYVSDTSRFVSIKAVASNERFNMLKMEAPTQPSIDLTDGFSNTEKYLALNTSNSGSVVSETDLATVNSLTIYNIPNNATREVAFMIMSDTTLQGLRDAVDSLPAVLASIYQTSIPIISDSLYCSVDSLIISPENTGDYRFYTSANLSQPVHAGRNFPLTIEDTGKVFYVTNADFPLESTATPISVHWAFPNVHFDTPDSLDLDSNPTLPVTNHTALWPSSQFSWEFGDGESSTDYTPHKIYYEMGNYTIKLRSEVITADNPTCIDSTSRALFAYRSNYLAQSEDTIICIGSPITLSPLGGTNFNFYQTETMDQLLGSGSSLHLTEVNEAQTVYISIIDSVLESAPIPMQIDVASVSAQFNTPDSIDLDTNPILPITNLTTSQPDAVYAWDFGDGSSSMEFEPSKTYYNMGNYSVKLVATAGNTICSDSLSRNLLAYRSNYLASLTDTIACFDSDLTLFPKGGQAFNYYQSADATGLLGSGSSIRFDKVNNAQTIYISVIDSVLESALIPVHIDVASVTTQFNTPDSIDLDTNPTLSISNFSTSQPSAVYAWDFDDGDTSNDFEPIKTYHKMGSYVVKLITTAGNTICSDSLSRNLIAYRSQHLANLADTTVCLGNPLELFPEGGSNFRFYQFEDATGFLGEGSSLAFSEVNYAQSIYISIIDSVFESRVIPVQIDVSSIDAGFEANNSIINAFIGDTLFLTADDALTYHWDFGNGQVSSLQNPIVNYTTAGSYTINLIVENEFGCNDTETQTITVIDDEPVWAANELRSSLSIYPNPTQENLNIRISSTNYKDFDIMLISSTGQEVFQNNILRSDGNLISFDLSSLKQGVYILKINMHGTTLTQRVIVNR